MKHLAVFVTFMAFTASAAFPKGVPSPPLITVSGEGVVVRSPDIATVNVSIETNADAAATALSDNNRKFDDLKNRMQALGIAEGDVNASSYNVNFNPSPPLSEGASAIRPIPYPNGQRYGYVVTRSITVKVRKVNEAGKVIDGSIAAGATSVNGVEFSVSNQRGAYAAALRAAVEDAQSQARAMAGAAHMRIARIRSMQSGYYPTPVMMRGAANQTGKVMSEAAPTVVKPENLDVRANVTIVYEMGPR